MFFSKATSFLIVSALIFSNVANANYVTVFASKKMTSGFLTTSTYNSNFTHTGGVNGTLTVVNGSGADIVLETCSGTLIKKLLCAAENAAKTIVANLERPSKIEIKINNKVVLTEAQLPVLKGRISVPVTLTASNSMSVKVGISPLAYITVSVQGESVAPNIMPVAKITASETQGFTPFVVTFSGLGSSDSDGTITSYDWNFGDGTTGNGMFVTHTFLTPGQRQVTLKVTDNKGGMGNSVLPITVLRNDPPIAQFTHSTETSLGDLKIHLDASASSDPDGTISSYEWDLGNGVTKQGVVLDYVYEQPGTYNVKLTVRDNNFFPTSLTKVIAVKDEVGPVLTINSPTANSKFYVRALPASIQVHANANENIVAAYAGNKSLNINPDNSFSGFLDTNDLGRRELFFVAQDRWGNSGTASVIVEVVQDNVAPVIGHGDFQSPTKESTIPLQIVVNEENPVKTTVKVNEVEVFSSVDKNFIASVPLNLEGTNKVKIQSVDAAGNASSPVSLNVIRDTTAPVLTFVNPASDDYVDGLSFQIKVTSNEALTGIAKINEKEIQISASNSIQSQYTSSNEGEITLTATATDLVGNVGSASIKVNSILKALTPSLIGLYPDVQNEKIIVKGASGSTRPNLTVKVSTGFFSSESVQADSKGGFILTLDPASEYKISVYDPVKEETFSTTKVYGGESDIILSGTVKESNDKPLVNATVRIAGTNLQTVTDAGGVFQFSRSVFPNVSVTGDQQLVVDGSTALIPNDGKPRKYSTTTVAITIGFKQSNILQTPIYLIPTLLDGSATTVVAASGGVVTDTNAPGVTLDIPAGATRFPNGVTQDSISLNTIPVELSTIEPIAQAMPKTVVALEPSGTTFTEPVKLVLPNVNSFPPSTEMVIMLMNSKTGKWEVGGSAVVTADGRSVATKDNQGIRHFSLAYATIAGPNIRQIGSKDRPGADTFNGAVTSKIEMPSFRTLGESYTPSLQYKSSWAKPNAVVTNLFDFANTKVNLEPKTIYGSQVIKYTIDLQTCTTPVTGTSQWCSSNPTDFYTNVQSKIDYYNITSEIQPEKVVARLKTGSLRTEDYEFKDLPHMASLSYALDLKDPSHSSGYFASGVHAYQASYDIHFKELILGTAQTTYWTALTDAKTTSPEEFKDIRENQLFKQDLTESLYVQNYRDSKVGRGWRIGETQKVLNPNGGRIALEEADGSLSSYALKNTIQSVFNVSQHNGSIKNGVALNAWPSIAVSNASSNSITKLTLSGSTVTSQSLGSNYAVSGTLVGFDFYNYEGQSCYEEEYCKNRVYFPGGNVCIEFGKRQICNNVPASFCSQTSRTFNQNAVPAQMIYLNNRVIGVDSARHAVFDMSGGQSTRLMGVMGSPNSFGNLYETQTTSHMLKLLTYCQDTPGMACGSLNSNDVNQNSYNACGTPPASSGQIAKASDEEVGGYQGLNSPMGITASPWSDTVVIADTGNHKVRWLNVVTRQSGVLVGNGTSADLGDGGLATQASIQHPQGVAYDSIGNLYISTKSGYVRKVDTNGYISTIAGNPLTGRLSSEAYAYEMLLNKPYGLVIDNKRSILYVADSGHNRVLAIDLRSDIASTVAGTGSTSSSGDGGAALNAGISGPTILGLDNEENLLVADTGGNSIRRIVFQRSELGRIAYESSSKDNTELFKESDGSFTRKYRSGSLIKFGSNGLQRSSSDRRGRTINYEYDTQGKLSRIAFPTGQNVTYRYSGDYLSSVVDPAGRETSFNYNWSGDLTRVNFPDGSFKKFDYDSDGLMKFEFDKNGEKTEFVYNAQSRVNKIIAADKSETIFNDGESNEANRYSTEVLNVPISIGSVENSIKDPNGNEVSLTKDFQGYISSIKNANGFITTFKRDENGRALEVIDHVGNVIKNTFNAQGDLISSKDMSTGVTESVEYDARGNVTAEIDGKGQKTTHTFDILWGIPIYTTLPDGKRIDYTYNSAGLVSYKSLTGGSSVHVETFEYDSNGNMIKKTNAQTGKSTDYEYDEAGNRTKEIFIANGLIVSKEYSFDSFNRLTRVKTPKGIVTDYEYSPSGELTLVRAPQGMETYFEYDKKRRLTYKYDSTGAENRYKYDSNNNVVEETDANGLIRKYSYSATNMMTRAQFSDDVINYVYDHKDQLKQISNNNSSVTYERDTKGRVTKEQLQAYGTLSGYPSTTWNNGYDANGNRTIASLGSAVNQFEYNSNNQITRVSTNSSDVFGMTYNGLGQISAYIRQGGSSAYSYSAENLTGIDNYTNGNWKSSISYSYESRNYPDVITKDGNSNFIQYDLDGQVFTYSNPDGYNVYSYDDSGNRVSENNNEFGYDNVGQKITSDRNYTYSIDSAGNLIHKWPHDSSKESFVFTYNSKNQLTQIRTMDGELGQLKKQVDYVYDVLGRRMLKKTWDRDAQNDIKKTFTRKYVYDGKHISLELNDSNNVLVRHVFNPVKPDDILMSEVTTLGQQAGVSKVAGKYYFAKDALGSVTDVFNSSGTKVQTYNYDVFGNIQNIRNDAGEELTSDPILKSTFTYTSRELDEESGLYYYRARYYDANIGRFIQKDPHPGVIADPATVVNSYVYVSNKPTIATDPSGEWWMLAGFLISFFINYQMAIDANATPGAAFTSGLIGGFSALIAPGAGSLIANAVGSKVVGFLAGNVIAGIFSGGAHATLFGGDMGQAMILGGAGGFVAGAFQLGAARMFFDMGFTTAAAKFLSEPFGYFGGVAINTGQELPQQDGADYRIRTRPQYSH